MPKKTVQHRVAKIVSGGQTGADRGALDAAMLLGIEHGGWCPLGRLAEDGTIPERYSLTETSSKFYRVRTEQNVIDSDGTLILYVQRLTGGTELTRRLAVKHDKPHLLVDIESNADENLIRQWIAAEKVLVLNVAGPRESSCPGIAVKVRKLLRHVLRP